MKIAIIGSRDLSISNLGDYVSENDEIVSGGANGIDRCAAEYAKKHGIKLTEYLPEYDRYGRAAPIIRNKRIVDCSDAVVAFWDGSSKGTLSVIKYAEKIKKPCKVIIIQK